MGLFSWLFGKPSRVAVRDLIWLTDEARLHGATQSVNTCLANGRSVLVLAHFPATLAAFGEHVVRAGRPHAAIPDSLTPAAALKLAPGSARVLFGLVRNLRPDEFPPETAPDSPLPVLVLERHFLRERDDHAVRFAEGLGGRAAVDFHVSLDDPLMQMFAGEWMKNALRGLGMKENEAIESRMVARRMAKAQAKVTALIASDHDADSAREWYERNRAS
jgi:hypothetical protein